MENNRTLSRRSALSLLGAAAALPFTSIGASAATAPVLVELFTSQGCSSCPPADKLAAKFKSMPGVHVASLNVDYWDYLGWHDTLAKPEYTQRQMDYAHDRGDNEVYTPQMVVNGAWRAVGSDKSAVETLIEKARAKPLAADLSLAVDDMEVTITMGNGAAVPEATLWLMALAPHVDVRIDRGENTGSTIAYSNVVRNLVPAGMWNGKSNVIKLPRKGIFTADCKSCIAVLQKGKVGPVLGLTSWGDTSA
ncbi:MAG: DUF1223 domain-containing protein [Aestuariivirga sp.]